MKYYRVWDPRIPPKSLYYLIRTDGTTFEIMGVLHPFSWYQAAETFEQYRARTPLEFEEVSEEELFAEYL